MDGQTLFGLLIITAMVVCYTFEKRSPWFILAFSGACFLASLYFVTLHAWLFSVAALIWTRVSYLRWFSLRY